MQSSSARPKTTEQVLQGQRQPCCSVSFILTFIYSCRPEGRGADGGLGAAGGGGPPRGGHLCGEGSDVPDRETAAADWVRSVCRCCSTRPSPSAGERNQQNERSRCFCFCLFTCALTSRLASGHVRVCVRLTGVGVGKVEAEEDREGRAASRLLLPVHGARFHFTGTSETPRPSPHEAAS